MLEFAATFQIADLKNVLMQQRRSCYADLLRDPMEFYNYNDGSAIDSVALLVEIFRTIQMQNIRRYAFWFLLIVTRVIRLRAPINPSRGFIVLVSCYASLRNNSSLLCAVFTCGYRIKVTDGI